MQFADIAAKKNLVYGPIIFKLWQVADLPPLMSCYVAFTTKGQKKASAASKGSFDMVMYGPILFQ